MIIVHPSATEWFVKDFALLRLVVFSCGLRLREEGDGGAALGTAWCAGRKKEREWGSGAVPPAQCSPG